MGAVSAVTSIVEDVASGVGDIVQGAVDTVSDVGSSVDDFVNDEIPGGWATVAIVAAPYMAPELAAAEATTASTPIFSEIMELPTEQLLSDYASAAATAVPATIEAAAPPTIDPIPEAPLAPEPVAEPAPLAPTPTVDPIPEPPSISAPVAELPPPAPAPASVVPELPPVQDLSSIATGPATTGSALTGALAGGAVGAAAGSTLENMMIPDLPPAPKLPAPKVYNPNWDIKFDKPVEYAPVPEFNFPEFKVSEPDPYLTKLPSVMGPVLPQGQEPAVYASNLIQSLRAASTAPATSNSGFTQYQVAK